MNSSVMSTPCHQADKRDTQKAHGSHRETQRIKRIESFANRRHFRIRPLVNHYGHFNYRPSVTYPERHGLLPPRLIVGLPFVRPETNQCLEDLFRRYFTEHLLCNLYGHQLAASRHRNVKRP